MKTIEEKIAVMQAFAEGKSVEVWDRGRKSYDTTPSPSWAWDTCDYRIKQEEVVTPVLVDKYGIIRTCSERALVREWDRVFPESAPHRIVEITILNP